MSNLLETGRVVVNDEKFLVGNNIPLTRPYFDDEDICGVVDSLKTTFVAGDGKKGKMFEEKFADYLGVKHAFLTSSCTAALDLAFMALNIREGEVIVPAFTHVATALAPLRNGLQIRLCDVDYQTANVSPVFFERSITDKTRAIIPVDYAGHPCDMDKINSIANERNLLVVHDAAQSCGSIYKERHVGGLADITCFSFQATKVLVTGEGGCLVTNNDDLADRIRVLRHIGDKKHSMRSSWASYQDIHEFTMEGNSYIQSDILGSLALTQLKKLDWMIEKRQKSVAYLNNGLKGIKSLILPVESTGVSSSWSLYTIRVPEERVNAIRKAINVEGVACDMHYRALHSYPSFQEALKCTGSDFPVASRVASTLLRLPMYAQLTKKDLDRIIIAVKKAFDG